MAETERPHIDVGQAFPLALLPQLIAAFADPRRGSAEFRIRWLPLMLGFRAAVGGQVSGGERPRSRGSTPGQ